MKIEEIISHQTNLITELNDRISTLEYILTQTMALIFKNVSGADAILLEMQNALTEKITNNGTVSTAGHKGFKTAEHIFTSIRECLVDRDDPVIIKQ